MTRNTVWKPSLVALALGAAACGQQSGRDYQGESLFTLRGTVTVPKELAGEDLVPVLTFNLQPPPEGGYSLEIVDVAVEGSFPSNFRLDIYEPPPEVTLHYRDGLPHFAVAHLSAMPRSHPSRLTSVVLREGDLAVERLCTVDESRCFEKKTRCVGEYAEECSVVSTSGDTGLLSAGYSADTAIAYAPEPIEADSAIAFQFNWGDAIPAGYQLFHETNVVVTSDGPPDLEACLAEAAEKANEDYNATHGTNHAAGAPWDSREFPWEYMVQERIRQRELGCLRPSFRRLADPATPLRITLVPLDSESS